MPQIGTKFSIGASRIVSVAWKDLKQTRNNLLQSLMVAD
ncbi:hypothetical protein [Spiroplasma poulsonii]